VSYSSVVGSSLFADAELHNNEKSEQALLKEITASHHLVRNNPLLRIGSSRFRASCIGKGAAPVFDPVLFGDDFITHFEQWMLYCDFYEHTNFAGLQALAVMTMLLDGSAFLVRRRTRHAIPLQIQVVSPLSLASDLERSGKSSYVRGGILYAKNGKIKQYAFYSLPRDHPNFDENKITWIPATDVIWLRDVIHAGQGSTQPWVAPGADFVRQYKDNQTVEIKSRMKRIGQQVFALRENDSVGQDPRPGAPRKKETLTHRAGGVTFLNGVKEIKTASPAEIAGNYQEHNQQVLRMIASLLGITYEMLTGDLTQVNYSSIRAGMINHRRFVEQLRKIVLEPALNRVLGWFIEAYQFTGTGLQDYFDNPYRYLAPTWIWPEWEEVDPLKAAKALVLEVDNHIRSQEEVANARGKTLNEQLDSVQRSQQAMNERGIKTDDDTDTGE